ncbi:UNVERIFIED_CONTAM: ATP-binding cassette sub- G member 1 [Siphonaria sp. JEL0065]|nr:ATP-binding cassette sub- G member 1 [Siphonaria sp. JEL0065]
MGASGAGKTSFLNLLAGEAKLGSMTGEIKVNSVPISGTQMKEISGFVFQDDVILPTMTVTEAITMSATLRLPSSVSPDERVKRVNHIIEELGLEGCKDTVIGDVHIKGVSGGERKRCAMAMEMVTNPQVLFLDEPTSGLDTFTAFSVIQSLRTIAHEDARTVVATIHQPSSEIFHLFDDLLLLADGRIMYQGPAHDAIDYFRRLGYPCPKTSNPADFFFYHIVNNEDELSLVPLEDTISAEDIIVKRVEGESNRDRIERLLGLWPSSEAHNAITRAVNAPCTAGIAEESKRTMAAFGTQVGYLFSRESKNSFRNPLILRHRVVQYIAIGLIIGLIYLKQGGQSEAVTQQNTMGENLMVFGKAKHVFMREYGAGYYTLPAYFLTKVGVEIPLQIIFPWAQITVIYFMAGLSSDIFRYFTLIGIVILASFVGFSIGVCCACSFPNLEVALLAVPLILMPMMLFSGFFVNTSQIPVWLRWIKYVSPMKYAFEGSIRSQLQGSMMGDMLINKLFGDEQLNVTHCCLILLLIMVSLIALAYFNLSRLNALTTFLKLANRSLQSDVTSLARVPNTPLGLKNLAATCYLNTLLQVWFHTVPFRSAVYDYQMGLAVADTNSNAGDAADADQIIKNLQIAFAYMQYGAKNVFDPSAFVKSLKIDSGVQQDAQEFSKLFLGIMETVFASQRDLKVRGMIHNLFEGQCSYITRCKSCAHESCRDEAFRDIELSITEKGTLHDSLSSYLTEEHMDDDNKWYCASCVSKQPATRQIRFSHLPSILNIQLLRFVYDVQRQTKRKVKTSMQFPEVLDMRDYVAGGGDANKDEYKYVLTAVLMHRGTSAYSEHIIARIRDPNKGTGVWYTFNDETVTKLESVGFDVVDVDLYDDDDGNVGGVSKKRKSAKEDGGKKKAEFVAATEAKSMDEKMFSSSVAYMLIYTRESEWKKSQDGLLHCNPPESLLEEIRSMNKSFEDEKNAYDDRQTVLTKEFEKMKTIRLETVSKGQVFSDDDPSYYVDAEQFKLWLNYGITAIDQADDLFEDVRDFKIEENGPGDSSGGSSSNDTGGIGLVEKDLEFDNKEILCEHKKLNFRAISKSKRLGMEAVNNLKANGFYFTPPLSEKDFCEECASSVLGERKHLSSHAANLEMFRDAQDTDFDCLYWISSSWLQEWQKKNPNFNNSGAIPLPIEDPFLSHVLCKHGGLSLNEKGRRQIGKDAFEVLKLVLCNDLGKLPKSDAVEVCGVCQIDHETFISDKAGMRDIAMSEKTKLKKLADGKQSMSTTIPAKASNFYLVPAGKAKKVKCFQVDSNITQTAFIENWRKFLRNPNQVERPGQIDNRVFICEHDSLCFDPVDEDDKPNVRYFILPDSDWIQLLEWYDATLIIEGKKGQRPDGTSYYAFDPVVCLQCKQNRFKNKKDVLVRLRNITQTDSPSSKKPMNDVNDKIDIDAPFMDLTDDSPTVKGKRKAPVSSFYSGPEATPARQSRRLAGRKTLEFRFSKNKTVLDLKTHISDKWNVPPIHQQLFFKGQELTMNNITIESLEVGRLDEFEVILLTEKKGFLLDDESSARGGQSKEMGFAGSNLMGFGAGQSSKKGEDAVMRDVDDGDDEIAMATRMSLESIQEDKGWNCPTCTFLNGFGAESCSICGTAHIL